MTERAETISALKKVAQKIDNRSTRQRRTDSFFDRAQPPITAGCRAEFTDRQDKTNSIHSVRLPLRERSSTEVHKTRSSKARSSSVHTRLSRSFSDSDIHKYSRISYSSRGSTATSGGQTEVFLDQLAPDLERPLDKTGGLRMLSRISSYSSTSKVPASYPTTFEQRTAASVGVRAAGAPEQRSHPGSRSSLPWLLQPDVCRTKERWGMEDSNQFEKAELLGENKSQGCIPHSSYASHSLQVSPVPVEQQSVPFPSVLHRLR